MHTRNESQNNKKNYLGCIIRGIMCSYNTAKEKLATYFMNFEIQFYVNIY